jgi:sugar transferase (PEP-CTERM/EpsH1 system associated)
MKILVLTPQLPFPPRQGATIRNFHLLKHLARRHQVDLLTFLAPGEQLNPDNPLISLCRRIGTLPQPTRSLTRRARSTLLSPLPDMALRLESAPMHDLIQQWRNREQYDIVQIEGIEMAQYGLALVVGNTRQDSLGKSGPLVVFDDHNCEYLLQKRSALTDFSAPRRWLAAGYSLVQWQKLRHYEQTICRRSAAVLAVSDADGAALQRLAPQQLLRIIPNGIDMAAYPAVDKRPAGDASAHRLVFVGKMDYRPNIDAMLWFGRHVLPLIQAEFPTVLLQIVGMNPHPRLDGLRANAGVEITGAVDDVRPYLQAATVALIPMRVGGGTRLKALEAMACARPIVSTALGVEGIGVTHGQELLIADRHAAFAAATLQLLHDTQHGGELSRRLGEQARRFVAAHYDWEKIAPKLESVYDQMLRVRKLKD